jgi:hypothetical protein
MSYWRKKEGRTNMSTSKSTEKRTLWQRASKPGTWVTEEVEKEVKLTDPQTGAQKGTKPEAYGLLPFFALEEVAKVYGYGANKYNPNNWRAGYPWSWSVSALFRHITSFLKGESVDPESNCHHLAHATFHLFLLMEYERLGQGTDDIPERGDKND